MESVLWTHQLSDQIPRTEHLPAATATAGQHVAGHQIYSK